VSLRPVHAWLSPRAKAYAWVVATLCLNVPILALLLARHLQGVSYLGLGGAYALLVFLGYYALGLFVLVTGVFVVSIVSTRLAVVATGALLLVALFYLAVNSVVHGIYRLHVDAFWLEYLLGSYKGLGLPPSLVGTGLVVVMALAGIEWGLFRVARRLPHHGRIATGFVVAAVPALGLSQAIHVVAYDKNDTRIMSITPQLPFYYPLTSYSKAVKYGDLISLIGESREPSGGDGIRSFTYPMRPVRCPGPAARGRPNILMIVLESWRFDTMNEAVSPNMHALSRRSSVFLQHFSSGNSTPHGIFGLFYGIHPTYWAEVKANSAAIDNPVLIDVLKDQGYAFGIYADSQFPRHKIKDTTFRGIEVHEAFAGATPDARDQDMTAQVVEFMEARHREGRPAFGFAFYKSTHYSYHYPPETARFRPFRVLNYALPGAEQDVPLYLNHYRNAVSYVDGLVGQIIRRLEASGLLNDTIVIVTSDHGEEFNDNGAGYWGHCGNFTEYQTRVPFMMYVPWQKPRQVAARTIHIDVPTTLVQAILGCEGDARDYSNGRSLFGPLDDERPLVIGSYINHALVIGDDVYAVYPMYVQKYKVTDIKTAAGAPRMDLMEKAMEEMHRFYGAADRGHNVARAMPTEPSVGD
jgi:uncharacterized protein